MRNLDECKAEIFSLSDKKIKQRKKNRKVMLSVCFPALACIVIVCLIPNLNLRHKLTPEASGSGNANVQEDASPLVSEEYIQQFEEIENTSAVIVEINDVTQNNEALNLIYSYYNSNYDYVQDSQTKGESKDETAGGNNNTTTNRNQSYMVTLVSETEGAVTYLINETKIYNKNNGAVINITQQEYEKLKDILGL